MAQRGLLDVCLANHLIGVYGSCRSVHCAQRIFDAMPERNVFSWTAIVAANARSGHYTAAVELVERMDVMPDGVFFVVLLGHLRGEEALGAGKAVHELIVREGLLERDLVVGNALLGMYDRCGDVSKAVTTFEAMPRKNNISWTTIIGAVAKRDGGERAMEFFHGMLLEGINLDRVSSATVLTACRHLPRSARSSSCLISIHGLIIEAGMEMDEIVGAAVADLYGRYGELDLARSLLLRFLDHHTTNALHWTGVIEAFSQRGRTREAVSLFSRMLLEGVRCDEVSLVSFANACFDVDSLNLAHGLLREAGLESVTKSANVLIVMYSRCRCLAEARKIFEAMLVRDIVSWNSIISAYVLHEEPIEAVKIFRKLDLEPTAVTYSLALDACAEIGDLETGRSIHERIVKAGSGIESSPGVEASLVNFYGKCGDLEQATKIFQSLSSRPWTSLAGAYSRLGNLTESLELFREMLLEGVKPSKAALVIAIDSIQTSSQARNLHAMAAEKKLDSSDTGVGNSLISMYSKLGDADRAAMVFQRMEKPDAISWNSLLACLAQSIDVGGASNHPCLAMFRLMQLQGQDPNRVTFLSVLSACSHRGLVDGARDLFSSMQRDFGVVPSVRHFGCVIDLLGRKGRLDEAEEVAAQMPVAPSVVLWTAFMGACSSHEDVDRAEEVAKRVLDMEDQNHSASALAMLSNVQSRIT